MVCWCVLIRLFVVPLFLFSLSLSRTEAVAFVVVVVGIGVVVVAPVSLSLLTHISFKVMSLTNRFLVSRILLLSPSSLSHESLLLL